MRKVSLGGGRLAFLIRPTKKRTPSKEKKKLKSASVSLRETRED